MTSNPTFMRRVFDAVGLFSFLNLLALGGLVLLAAGSGALNQEKLQRMTAIMRGNEPAPKGSGEPVDVPDSSSPTRVESSRDLTAESDMDKEILRREAERIKAELEQRLALNNSILLRVTAERERFARLREQEATAEKIREEQRAAEGFRKQVELFEALSPKIAVQHLMALEDPDEAARLLVEMETRKARKIVEAAKSGHALAKMQVVLRRLREVAPDRSNELESEE
jgi:hypothetical protein